MSKSAPKKRRRPSSAELSSCFHRACQQEAGALQQLLGLYRPLLMKLAQQRIQGALRVKVAPSDLVQSTVWKATQNFSAEEFADRNGFLAWLVTILKHEAADLRRRYREAQKRDLSRERPLFSPETQQWLSRLSASLSVSDACTSPRGDILEELLAALDRLPTHYQLVLRLRYYQRLKFEAIGRKLGRTADAARVLHNRALKKIRDELARERLGDESPPMKDT